AGRTRISVLAPDAAEVLRFLEDGEIVEARLLQVIPHAEPGEAGADDGDGRLRTLLGGGHGARQIRRSARSPAGASARTLGGLPAPRARAASARNAGLRAGSPRRRRRRAS